MKNGFDTLRIIALALVTWQHAASVFGAYAETQWRGISLGQTGVGIFCAISGYLAFRNRPDSIPEWLKKRLLRIFPAYWIVTVVAFLLTAISSVKDFSGWMFLSQMLGLGYFTHGWHLVNVVSWFISLILLCYVLSALCWQVRRPDVLLLVLTSVAMALCAMRWEGAISRHVIAFCLAGYFAYTQTAVLMWMAAILLMIVGVRFNSAFFYSGIGVALVLFASSRPLCASRVVEVASKYSYEYFLVHGIFLVGVARFVSNKPLALALALAGSAVGAVFVHHFSNMGTRLVQRALLRAN